LRNKANRPEGAEVVPWAEQQEPLAQIAGEQPSKAIGFFASAQPAHSVRAHQY
jgi:hypothetical protein